MFFVYLFFGVGILATLLAVIPSLIEVITYTISMFATFRTKRDNKIEVKKALLEKKKELKLADIKNEVIVEEKAEERINTEIVNDIEEIRVDTVNDNANENQTQE